MHPCHFVYVCAAPFADRGNNRRALHISQNCPKALVDAIEFETYLPPDSEPSTYMEHYDANGSCELADDGLRQKCSTTLNKPKLTAGDEFGNDDAWLLPAEYNDGDYPWSYKYWVYRANPDI